MVLKDYGGYSVGTLNLKNNATLYLYIGEQGYARSGGIVSTGSISGGWNGGGNSYANSSEFGGSGGGATDIALYGTNNSTIWNNTNHLYSRIIVAGGGGGTGDDGGDHGGHGGGVAGTSEYSSSGKGGSQTLGGTVGTESSEGGIAYSGKFGIGGLSTGHRGSGGGGGWYRRWCLSFSWVWWWFRICVYFEYGL